MRFIRQEHLITTVCDKEVLKVDVIRKVLSNLLKERIEFSLSMRKKFQNSEFNRTLSYDKVKVHKVATDNVDLIVFSNKQLTHINNVLFEDIVEIYAITKKNRILDLDPDVNRFGLMDIGEIEE